MIKIINTWILIKKMCDSIKDVPYVKKMCDSIKYVPYVKNKCIHIVLQKIYIMF